MGKLTDISCKKARCPAGQTVLKLADGKGLYLWVFPEGRKVWRLRYAYAGREKTLTLGEYPEPVSLAEAREAAADARKTIKAGTDPVQQRRVDKLTAEAAAAATFEAVAREWIAQKIADGEAWAAAVKANGAAAGKQHGWTAGTADAALGGFRNHLFPHLGPRPIAEVEARELLAALRIVERSGAVYWANKLRSLLASLFRYAIVTGRCDRNPAADLVGALRKHAEVHQKAIAPDELAAFLRTLHDPLARLHPYTRLALQLLTMTMTRPGEVRAAEWSEFDLEACAWEIPAERMKMRVPHRVPLARQAVEVLRQLQPLSGGGRYLFPKVGDPTACMSDNTMAMAIKARMGFDATAHGMRAVASTILNEAGWRPEVIEAALSHQDRNDSRRPYNRADYWKERTKMTQWYADHLDAIRTGAKVIPIRRRSNTAA